MSERTYYTAREPQPDDARALYQIARTAPYLRPNNYEYYSLIATFFSRTSAVAETREGRVVGFAAGYVLPDRPNTLHISQMACQNLIDAPLPLGSMLGRIITHQPALTSLELVVAVDDCAARRAYEMIASNVGARSKIEHHPHIDSADLDSGQSAEPRLVQELICIGPFVGTRTQLD